MLDRLTEDHGAALRGLLAREQREVLWVVELQGFQEGLVAPLAAAAQDVHQAPWEWRESAQDSRWGLPGAPGHFLSRQSSRAQVPQIFKPLIHTGTCLNTSGAKPVCYSQEGRDPTPLPWHLYFTGLQTPACSLHANRRRASKHCLPFQGHREAPLYPQSESKIFLPLVNAWKSIRLSALCQPWFTDTPCQRGDPSFR